MQQNPKAKDIFSSNEGCELKIAYCNNLLGLICTHLKDYALAEEYFISAMDTFQKKEEKRAIFTVRHNLGLLYANQNQSLLAIRYLAEVSNNDPTHYKSMFIEATEHYKLDHNENASMLIVKGLEICEKLENTEYRYRFKILEALNNKVSGENLEKVILAGMDYFKREDLWEYVQQYSEILAVKFHREGNLIKGSTYFYLSFEAKEHIIKKEGLK